uniref:Uncharacterized protein n=1 Tax=Acrobeloides nanus TaxID=290746 RepID=A0A914CD80_9BILA
MLSSKVAAFIQSEKLAATLVSRAYVTIHQPPPGKPNTTERKTREETEGVDPALEIAKRHAKEAVGIAEGVDPALEIAKRHAKEAVGIAENVIKGKSADAPQKPSQTEKIVKETIGKTAEQAKSTAKAAKEKITDTMKKASEKIFGARQVGESRPPEKRLGK